MSIAKITHIILFCCAALTAKAQTNIHPTDNITEQVMLGNYAPATYQASVVINDHGSISNGIHARVSPDSLHSYMDSLRDIPQPQYIVGHTFLPQTVLRSPQMGVP